MEGEGPPPPKKPVFDSSISSSSSLFLHKTEETLVSKFPSPARNKPFCQLASLEQSSCMSPEFLFQVESTRQASPSPDHKPLLPESPRPLGKKPDYQRSPPVKTPTCKSLDLLFEDEAPCTSSSQVQGSLHSESPSLLRKNPSYESFPTAEIPYPNSLQSVFAKKSSGLSSSSQAQGSLLCQSPLTRQAPHEFSPTLQKPLCRSLDLLSHDKSDGEASSNQVQGSLLSESSLLGKKQGSKPSPKSKAPHHQPPECLFDDDSASAFSFDLFQGTVLSESSLGGKKPGSELSPTAQTPHHPTFDFLFDDDDGVSSSSLVQGTRLFEFPVLGKEPDYEFSPLVKTPHDKSLDSPCVSSSQVQRSLVSPSLLRKKPIYELCPTVPQSYSQSLELLFQGKPIWEPPPPVQTLAPDTTPPMGKKAASEFWPSPVNKAQHCKSLDHFFKDSSACEPSPSEVHKAVLPAPSPVEKMPAYKLSPAEQMPPLGNSLDFQFEDESTCDFSSQTHKAEVFDSPPLVTKKPSYDFSPSMILTLPPKKLFDFLFDDLSVSEPSYQVHDSEISAPPPSAGKKPVSESPLQGQARPAPLSPSFPIEDEETHDYISVPYNRSEGSDSPSMGKKSLFAAAAAAAASPPPTMQTPPILLDEESAGESSNQVQETLPSEAPLSGKNTSFELLQSFNFLVEDDSSSESRFPLFRSIPAPSAPPVGKPAPESTQYPVQKKTYFLNLLFDDSSDGESFPSATYDIVLPETASTVGQPASEFSGSQDQEKLISESSSAVEKPVAKSFISQVHYPSGEQRMSRGASFHSQVPEKQVFEFSSALMPKMPATEAIPSQEPDDDDDSDNPEDTKDEEDSCEAS
ncbi:uncharacterized protein LOC144454977 [Phascolarctos cinereus]